MRSRLDRTNAIWQWELSQQGEQTPAAIAGTLRWYADSRTLLVKVMDGTAWMGGIEAGNVDSLESWYQFHDSMQALGVQAIPWVVPTSESDAPTHAAINPVLVVDMEIGYKGFFQGDGDAAFRYVRTLRARGVEAWVSYDPRQFQTALAALTIADGVMPQVYWTDFNTGPSAVMPYIDDALSVGRPVVPVLPATGTPNDIRFAGNAMVAAGCAGVSLWRLGSAGIAELRAFAAIARGV